MVMMDGRKISNRQLQDTDLLIIRTATRVNAELLTGTPVRFVGTTSIGTDHLDIPWLEQQGIAWANAPGCNADSTAQYTLAMIWLACERLGRDLAKQRVGIVGCGNVGSRVQRLLRTMGAITAANDPPLADAGKPGLVTLEEALDNDIVCLHVPLTREGPYATHRFIGREQFSRMPGGALLVNTARGNVVDGEALLENLVHRRLHAALDVWPGEPLFPAKLLDATTVATPHVAGYSDDGKRAGTRIVYEAYCRWAGLTGATIGHDRADGPELTINADEDGIAKALDASCFVRLHDDAMRKLAALSLEERAANFDRLRRDYPTRRDFQAWTIHCNRDQPAELLQRLGFTVATS